jgi:hypothetical protein
MVRQCCTTVSITSLSFVTFSIVRYSKIEHNVSEAGWVLSSGEEHLLTWVGWTIGAVCQTQLTRYPSSEDGISSGFWNVVFYSRTSDDGLSKKKYPNLCSSIRVTHQVSHPNKISKSNSVWETYMVAKVYLYERISVGNQLLEFSCWFLVYICMRD